MEAPRQVLEVNIQVILRDILIQLGLPDAGVGIHAVTHDKLKAYVELYEISNVSGPVRFIGSPSSQLHSSQQNAARQAIKFLQESYNFDVADFNYYKLILLQNTNYQLL